MEKQITGLDKLSDGKIELMQTPKLSLSKETILFLEALDLSELELEKEVPIKVLC